MESKRNINITGKELISRGYKNYNNHPFYKDTDDIKYEFFQKCVTDETGKKLYFIDAIHSIVNTSNSYRGGWSFSIQLNPSDYDTIEVETVQWFNEFSDTSNDRGNSLDKVEELFDKLYKVLKCKSYD
jgi:hypothetical protein